MPERVKLTKRTVDAAPPADKMYVLWDRDLAGLGLKVYPSGTKTFVFKYRIGGGRGGQSREPVVGRYGAVTTDEARSIAKDWAAAVRRGGDPSGERKAQRVAPRMEDLFARYLSDHAELKKKASSLEEDRRLIRQYLLPAFKGKKVGDLERPAVMRWHRGLADKPYRANRALALLSKACNLAELWGWRPDSSNPCRHIEKYKEHARERFLNPDEFSRLGNAMDAAERGEIRVEKQGRTGPMLISPYAIAAIRLLMFTGARRGEILSLRWSEVRLEAGRLELPDSKTGKKFVYLSEPAAQVIRGLKKQPHNPYVIVGGKPGRHLVNLKDPWGAIRAAAGLEGVRIHDLRHSFASAAVAGGMSLPMIGALLGHKDPSTTARYAHLADDPKRAAAEMVASAISRSMR